MCFSYIYEFALSEIIVKAGKNVAYDDALNDWKTSQTSYDERVDKEQMDSEET